MIKMTSSGSFKNSFKLFRFFMRGEYLSRLDEYGKQGVAALSAATPVRTGKTAASWSYEIKEDSRGISITWTNSNIAEPTNIPVVILLYNGHGTRGGHWVQGRDFITPSIRPVFDKIAEDVWKEVTKA